MAERHIGREIPRSFRNELSDTSCARPCAGRDRRRRGSRRRPQSTDIAKVEAHLAAVQSMTANFTQTDARSRVARGTLQLKRPGRIRFQYQGGDLLLVANGSKLTFVDYQVGQKNSWELTKTPLGVLLVASPDIGRIAKIMPQSDPRILVVRARDPAGRSSGP